jgi:hypothetical protein
MTVKALARPLVQLAKHRVSCTRTARVALVNNNRRPTFANQYSTYASIPDSLLPAFMIRKTRVAPSYDPHLPLRQLPHTDVSHARHFSASPTPKATIVTANPRKDEDGNEMLIEITARAATVCIYPE